jgi:hypothetical protein
MAHKTKRKESIIEKVFYGHGLTQIEIENIQKRIKRESVKKALLKKHYALSTNNGNS